jgi:hypothetical protein
VATRSSAAAPGTADGIVGNSEGKPQSASHSGAQGNWASPDHIGDEYFPNDGEEGEASDSPGGSSSWRRAASRFSSWFRGDPPRDSKDVEKTRSEAPIGGLWQRPYPRVESKSPTAQPSNATVEHPPAMAEWRRASSQLVSVPLSEITRAAVAKYTRNMIIFEPTDLPADAPQLMVFLMRRDGKVPLERRKDAVPGLDSYSRPWIMMLQFDGWRLRSSTNHPHDFGAIVIENDEPVTISAEEKRTRALKAQEAGSAAAARALREAAWRNFVYARMFSLERAVRDWKTGEVNRQAGNTLENAMKWKLEPRPFHRANTAEVPPAEQRVISFVHETGAEPTGDTSPVTT